MVAIGVFLALACSTRVGFVFAEDETAEVGPYYVTIHDGASKLTVKTSAGTVREVIERAKVELGEFDLVEPVLDTIVDGEDFNVNIYRARPALVIDGTKRHYIMTASYDPKEIMREAGVTVYDGDEIDIAPNSDFLEAGAVSTYRIERSGGRTLTLEESIPYPVETRRDYNLAKGEQHLEQAGEDGRKVSTYAVQFENNIEVSRELISEEVKLEPVPEIIVVGAKVSIAPERQQCAHWAREAGVSEEDLQAALDLIYHESGCRVDAENAGSGAYGIPQALPGTKMQSAGDDWQTNPVTQIRWMSQYVNRYGGWQGAMAWWWEHKWY